MFIFIHIYELTPRVKLSHCHFSLLCADIRAVSFVFVCFRRTQETGWDAGLLLTCVCARCRAGTLNAMRCRWLAGCETMTG